MNTFEIDDFLSEHRNVFKGVFPKNKIPKKYIIGGVYIINTDCICYPGQHWIALYANPHGFLEFFDSFAMDIKQYAFLNSDYSYLYSTQPLQSVGTATCGIYCILFAISKIKGGYTFQEFLNLFDHKNAFNNDIDVWLIAKHIFGFKHLPLYAV